MQFHPLAYIVKLNIEMSMADLIRRIARKRHNNAYNNGAGDSSSSSNYHASLRSRGTSISKQNSNKVKECSDRLGITARAEFNSIVRPDAAYTVGATADHCVESGLCSSQNIYTTREFCIDFEEKPDRYPESSAERGEAASTSRTEYEDIKAIERY